MSSPIRRRRTAAGATAFLAVGMLALAGCSSDSPSTDVTNGIPSADVPVTIKYVHRLPDGDGMVKVADIAGKWNAEHPDFTVETTKFDGASGELIAKLETDSAAGTAPCLAQVDYSEIPEMYTKGFLADVSEYTQQYQENFSGAYALMTVGEATVGLPQDTGPLVYYYNKAKFDELGLNVPTTLDEFKTTAAIAAKGGHYISAFQPDEAKFWMSAQAAAAGATWYSAENGAWTISVDSPESAVVANFWQSMIDDGTTTVLNRWSDAFAAALTDQTLIGTIGAAWEAPLLANAMAGTENDGQWAVAPLPNYGAGKLTGPDGGSGMVVLAGCEHPERAVAFANFFNTQIPDLVSQGLVVAAKGDMVTPDAIAAFYGGQDVFGELAAANASLSANFTYMPGFSTVADPMSQAASAAGDGSGPVADVFTAAQDQSVKTLKNLGLPVNN